MIQYHVRSRYLVDIVNDIQSGKIILSPYFQRKLVWREGHKVDFIKTILLGYPFPEIFLSRGKIDLETMTSRSSIVDGQQRMNSICEYIQGKFPVDGKTYQELSSSEKENFLKYEIAIIDLDLADNDAKIVEIFQRLNRTFYALSDIEKTATEFASSEFMLVAKLLCGELPDDTDGEENVGESAHKDDPNITREFIQWANGKNVSAFREFLLEKPIFSKYEISRNVHLRFTLNVMATQLVGYYMLYQLACLRSVDYRLQCGTMCHIVALSFPNWSPWVAMSVCGWGNKAEPQLPRKFISDDDVSAGFEAKDLKPFPLQSDFGKRRFAEIIAAGFNFDSPMNTRCDFHAPASYRPSTRPALLHRGILNYSTAETSKKRRGSIRRYSPKLARRSRRVGDVF